MAMSDDFERHFITFIASCHGETDTCRISLAVLADATQIHRGYAFTQS
jgi:hypothetical protein